MGLGGFYILWRRVDAGDFGAESGQRLGDQPPAAADIEHRHPGQARSRRLVPPEFPAELVADISEPDGIDAMERLERAIGVPPFPGKLGEAGHLIAVERGRAVGGGGCHRPLAAPLYPLSSRAEPLSLIHI